MGEAGRGGPHQVHGGGEGLQRGAYQERDQEAAQGPGGQHTGPARLLLQGTPPDMMIGY